jgi:hypothetical protein
MEHHADMVAGEALVDNMKFNNFPAIDLSMFDEMTTQGLYSQSIPKLSNAGWAEGLFGFWFHPDHSGKYTLPAAIRMMEKDDLRKAKAKKLKEELEAKGRLL